MSQTEERLKCKLKLDSAIQLQKFALTRKEPKPQLKIQAPLILQEYHPNKVNNHYTYLAQLLIVLFCILTGLDEDLDRLNDTLHGIDDTQLDIIDEHTDLTEKIAELPRGKTEEISLVLKHL